MNVTWYRLVYLIAAMFGVSVFVLSCTIAYLVGYDVASSDHALEVAVVAAEEFPVVAAEEPHPEFHDNVDHDFADLSEIPWEDQPFKNLFDGWDEPVFWDAPHPNAKVLESGIAILNLEAPTAGVQPISTDRVVIDWIGWTTDGNVIDDSYERELKPEYLLANFIPGFSEAIQNMREGEIVRVWIPEELAYKRYKNKPQGMLIFDIELHEVKSTYVYEGCSG